MSIQSEIDRLAQAKFYIAQAIGDKGVEVPADATLDEFHSYIGAIPSPGSTLGERLGTYNTFGGVIDTPVSFGQRAFYGLAAVSDAYTIVAVGAHGRSVGVNHWVSNVITSSRLHDPATGWLTFKAESGAYRMTWTICPDGSISDRMFTLYGL